MRAYTILGNALGLGDPVMAACSDCTAAESARRVCSPALAPTHPPRTDPTEACGTANRWSGVVRGTKVVGKSHARALRRRFPAPHPFDLNVPEGGRRGGAGLQRLLLNRRLNPFLGGGSGPSGGV